MGWCVSPGVKSIVVYFEGLVVKLLDGERGVLGSSDELGGDGDSVFDLEVGAAFCDDVGAGNEDEGVMRAPRRKIGLFIFVVGKCFFNE